MMGHVEALESLEAFPGASTAQERAAVLAVFVDHARAMKAVYEPGKLWRQLVNDSSAGSFHETSVTAMTLTALCRGVLGGYLEREEFDSVIRGAWAALVAAVADNGEVSLVCSGTGIQ